MGTQCSAVNIGCAPRVDQVLEDPNNLGISVKE